MSWKVFAYSVLLASVFRIAHSVADCNSSMTACDYVLRLNPRPFFDRLVHVKITPDQLPADCSAWYNCSTFMRSAGCTWDDMYHALVDMYNTWDRRFGFPYWYYWNVQPAVASMILMCDNETQGYADYYDCYSRNNYSDGLSRCEAIMQAKYDYPFDPHDHRCNYALETATCFFRATNGTCSYQLASYFASIWFRSTYTWTSTYICNYNLTSLLIASSRDEKKSCDVDGFFLCLSKLPQIIDAESTFKCMSIHGEQLYCGAWNRYGKYWNLNNSTAICSDWNSFLGCSAQSGCNVQSSDMENVTWSINNDAWNWNPWRMSKDEHLLYTSFNMFNYTCGEGRGLLKSVGLCPYDTRASWCYSATSVKLSYPFYKLFGVCRAIFENAVCVYEAAVGQGCNETSVAATVAFRTKYYELWYRQLDWPGWPLYAPITSENCSFEFSAVKSASHNVTGDRCRDTTFIECLVQSGVNLYPLYDQAYYGQLLNGLLSRSWHSTNCRTWETFHTCWQCSNSEIVYRTVDYLAAYIEGNGHNTTGQTIDDFSIARYLLNNIMSPRRMDLLCSADISEFSDYENCIFESGGFDNSFWSCISGSYELLGLCHLCARCFRRLYSSIVARCPVKAGLLVLQYMMVEWSPYLEKKENCLLNVSDIIPQCDEFSCTSLLKSYVGNYTQLLKNGQLASANLTAACSLASDSSSCITDIINIRCNLTEVSLYRALIDDVTPYLCANLKQQAYLTKQSCYVSQMAAVASTVSQLFSSVNCSDTRQSLFSLYATLSASCGQSTAEAVAGLAAQFRIIAALPPSIAIICPNLLHPSESAIPLFSGPHYNYNTNYSSSCVDFYFKCRVNYSSSPADNGARFDVSLTFNGQLATSYKTTNSTQLEVIFTQYDIVGHLGTTVSCAVRSYWDQLPSSKSDFINSAESYFVGITYWTDTGERHMVSMAESVPYMPIFFRATVPLSCPPISMTLQLSAHTGLIVSSCSVTFTSSDSPSTFHRINIRAVQTPGLNSRVVPMKFNAINTTSPGSPWDGYQLKEIPVLVVDELHSKSCMSDGDPHIRTFDDYFYSVFYAGDFVLWRSMRDGTAVVEVHVRFQHCFMQTVSCNCAVAFREGNNIIGVYACDENRPPMVIVYMKDKVSPASVHVGNGGLHFYIRMPSGRSMSVDTSCGLCRRLSIVVYAISEDVGRSEGLCGNYNGINGDDTIPKGSVIPDLDHEPISFSKSFLLRKEQSFINGHIYLPICTTANITLPTECRCGQTAPENCEGVTATAVSLIPAVTFGTYGTESCNPRHKRQTGSQAVAGNFIGPSELLPADPGPPPNTTLYRSASVNSTISISQARSQCEEPLLKSPIYSECAAFTPDVKEAILQSCSMDTQLTGRPEDIVDGILLKYSEACVRGVMESDRRNADQAVTEYNASPKNNATKSVADTLLTSRVSVVLRSVADQMCPGQPQCSGNGTCLNQTCACNEGFTGIDCSLPAGVPPVITGLRYGSVCDVRNHRVNCSLVSLFVSGASVTNTFSCRITSSAGTFYPDVRLASVVEIQFDLPISPLDDQSTIPYYTWNISISNTNDTFSNMVLVHVYDSKCVDCSNETGLCWHMVNSCLIADRCFEGGEQNPSDACMICSPAYSNSSWTNDTVCGQNSSATEHPQDVTTPGSTATQRTRRSTPTTTQQETASSHYTTSTGVQPLTTPTSTTQGQRTTTTQTISSWSEWGVWSPCSIGCSIQRISVRERTCAIGNDCIGDRFEMMNCPMDSCAALPEENYEGLVVITTGNNVAKFSSTTFVLEFYDTLINVINEYCTSNKKLCCSLLLSGTSYAVSPAAEGNFTIASRNVTRIAASYPQAVADNTLIKMIFKARRSRIIGYCAVGVISRRKRQADDTTEIYLNKELLVKATEPKVNDIAKAVNLTIESIVPSPDASTTTSSPWQAITISSVVGSVIGVVMIIITCIVLYKTNRPNRGKKVSQSSSREPTDKFESDRTVAGNEIYDRNNIGFYPPRNYPRYYAPAGNYHGYYPYKMPGNYRDNLPPGYNDNRYGANIFSTSRNPSFNNRPRYIVRQ